ncbi:MAG: hypothetical protein GEU80_08670 [Dehalococcoidia bacterium]|nr:hypothetical protein [Dehalococcoidia bacterium]
MPNRPMPEFPELDTQPFWDAAKRRELAYQTCSDCNEVVFYPRAHCTKCGSLDTTWHTSSGAGTVYTYSVVRQNRSPHFADLGAYAVAYVDLDEGFRMLTNVVGVDNPTTDVQVGMRVQVEFEDQEGGEYPIPVFRPA